MIKKGCLFLVLVAFALLLPGIFKRWTHSFHLSRLWIDLPYHSNWDIPARLPEEELAKIFSQEFDYLDRGSQAFVFASRDYVLKLFILEDESHAIKTLEACQTAMRYLPQETGLIAVHLNRGLAPQVTLVGPAWHRQTIALDNIRYVLQQRATSLKEALMRDYKEGNRSLFDAQIDSFLAMLDRRIACGIFNSDSTLFDNLGVIDGRVVEIDFGNYVYCPELFVGRRPQEERARYTTQFTNWVEQNMPEWVDSLAR